MIHEQFVDGLERQKLYSCSEESREANFASLLGHVFVQSRLIVKRLANNGEAART
jgi:hypothetical protein